MHETFCRAVSDGGAVVGDLAEARALVWADPQAVDAFPEVIASAPNVEWIQLPYAGIEPFARHLDGRFTWTCGKGVYAEPVAEHVIALALAGLRGLARYVPATSWKGPVGRNLLGATITVIGGGGITESLLRLLGPWNTTVRVVRRHPAPMTGAASVVGSGQLIDAVRDADVVVLACALTKETVGIVDASVLAAMQPHAWLVNVARGAHVVNEDLLTALRDRSIGGAALDVTDPEPLPDDHPLWAEPRCIITPHVANTPEMGLPLIAARVRDNVERWVAGRDLLGPVDVGLGY